MTHTEIIIVYYISHLVHRGGHKGQETGYWWSVLSYSSGHSTKFNWIICGKKDKLQL